ncbi:hypothetical protein [Desulfonatronum thioautotrophicum]|uniref:hypothetical protein n=1 Tax=Desulfonatronum thioautotrophicum TaxID=617001 RepID=UPI00129476C7|nr:hypothetical protein [Desulfonatronum thioautotrophicum]
MPRFRTPSPSSLQKPSGNHPATTTPPRPGTMPVLLAAETGNRAGHAGARTSRMEAAWPAY